VLLELGVAEQRYRAILAVIEDGLSVTELTGGRAHIRWIRR
jgi:hypothetical protein